MNKMTHSPQRKKKHPSPLPHHVFKDIRRQLVVLYEVTHESLIRLEALTTKVNHLVREGDHIETLITALGSGVPDPEGLREILDAINQNKAKLAAALPADSTITPSPQS